MLAAAVVDGDYYYGDENPYPRNQVFISALEVDWG
jgi:hypothetical protein